MAMGMHGSGSLRNRQPSSQSGPPAANPSIQVVVNWTEELKQLVPLK
jgi:hypothetical protein